MINSLSIIIPALNEEKYLPKLLSSIYSQNFIGNLQVIIADGGSTDNTIIEAEKFKDKIKDLTVIQTTGSENKKGIGYQRNKGAKLAKYSNLIFIDSDMVLPQNCLNNLAQKIKTSRDFFAATLILPLYFDIIDYIGVFLGYLFVYAASFYKPIASGMFLFTSKKNHEKIGGFNENAVLGEDIDYGFRSTKAGAKYFLFITPYVFSSPRRKKQLGRIGLLFTWFSWYIYNIKHGPILDENKYHYPFGQYTKGD